MNAITSVSRNVIVRASKVAKPAAGFKGLVADNKTTLKNLGLSAVVACLQLLLSAAVFDCPLENHVAYGTMFLLAPVIIIFIANALLISKLGKLTDRIFVRRYYRRCDSCWVIPNVIKSMVGPAVWLITSFVDGPYYTCAVVGPSIEKRNITNVTAIKELEAQFARAKSMSHIWAWIIFLAMVIVTAFVVASKKCCLKDDALLEDDYTLERREAISAMLMFRYFIDNPHEIAVFIKEEDGTLPPDSKAYDCLVTSESIPKAEAETTENSTGEADSAAASPPGEPDSAAVSPPGEPDSAAASPPDKEPTPPPAEIPGGEDGIRPTEASPVENDENDRETDRAKHEIIKGRFVGGDEKIEIHVNGIPERNGRKWVIEKFKDWSEDNKNWSYDKVYTEFAKKYPRVTSGRPREEWVARKDEIHETQGKTCCSRYKKVNKEELQEMYTL